MTTQSNAELREDIAQLIYNGYIQHREGASYDDLLEKVNALFQSQQQQLLQELMDDFPTLTKKTPDDSYNTGYDDAITEAETIIQNKLEGLR